MDFYAWILIVAMASFFIGFLFGVLFSERNYDVALAAANRDIKSLTLKLGALLRQLKVDN